MKFQPQLKNSYFNADKQFDPRTHYAVTLLRGADNNHAQIFIEGENEQGQSFVQQAHFVGPKSWANNSGDNSYFSHGNKGQVKDFKTVDLQRVRFGSKATWIISKAEVERMIAAVHAEHEMQQNERKHIPFNILGRNSIFNSTPWQISKNTVIGTIIGFIAGVLLVPTGLPEMALGFAVLALMFGGASASGVMTSILHQQPHSCITWAKEKLAIAGVHIKLSPLQYLFSYTTEAIELSQNQLREDDFVIVGNEIERENIPRLEIS